MLVNFSYFSDYNDVSERIKQAIHDEKTCYEEENYKDNDNDEEKKVCNLRKMISHSKGMLQNAYSCLCANLYVNRQLGQYRHFSTQ